MSAAELLARRARQVRHGGADVPSPCISVCRIDPASAWCEGCWRTLEEVADWGRMEDQAKRAVWRLIEQRLRARPAAAAGIGSA